MKKQLALLLALLMKQSKDVASTLEKGEKAMIAALDKVVAAYQENQ